MNEPTAGTVLDPQNPWLGLDSFTEATRAYFHGRDGEITELARRVQRKLLTVLFGQSGLGKTSILRAGLVPRLRAEGFGPVYVRMDYSADAPSPTEQIKQAILRSTEHGDWTRSGYVAPGESLWAFLHHREGGLRDAAGRTLIPLLIFDQFEEVFTVAQSDDAARERAATFLTELSDLIENRPPAALEARIERDEVDPSVFDFGRTDYRIVISLREDYLAHLEGLKGQMPSVTQNRLRLARMTGAQALEAILQPGGGLVTEEIARQIVMFVSGADDFATAEVEPSLLSLVCRELNNARLAQRRAEISADLLAGSHATILADFYERAFADQPAAVRRFVEDELLTDSGYRESIAEERLAKAFAAAAAPADSLAKLVDRRLLRVEERLDRRRIELTHDVLCAIVAASRDTRREREAKEAAERELAETRAQEAETRRVLRRTRLVAIGCATLAVVAIGSVVFGYLSVRRTRAAETAARAAEAKALATAETARQAEARALAAAETARTAQARAQRTRELADGARAQAEKLVEFLLDDFYQELAPTGRVDTLARLAKNVADYFDSLPPALRSTATARGRAIAIARRAMALRRQRDPAGNALPLQAVQDLERIYATEDQSEPTIIGLAIALLAHGELVGNYTLSGPTAANLERAEGLLRPLASAPGAPVRLRMLFAEVLFARGYRNRFSPEAARKPYLVEAQQILADVGALDLSNLAAASAYAKALHWRRTGDRAEYEAQQREALELAEKVLLQRPSDIEALRVRASALGFLPVPSTRREHAWEDVIRFDPRDTTAYTEWITARNSVALIMESEGRITEALAKYRQVVADANAHARSALSGGIQRALIRVVELETSRGHHSAAAEAQIERERIRFTTRQLSPGRIVAMNNARTGLVAAAENRRLGILRGDYHAVLASTAATAKLLADLQSQATPDGFDASEIDRLLEQLHLDIGEANVMLGRFAEAELALRLRIFNRQNGAEIARPVAWRFWLAMAIARQGRGAEARALLGPTYASVRARRAEVPTTVRACVDLARAMFVHAIAAAGDDEGRGVRTEALAAAQSWLDVVPGEGKQLYEVRTLTKMLNEERARL